MPEDATPRSDAVEHRTPTTWQLERAAPVRADSESIFVPTAELPDATLGDIVVVTSAAGGPAREGTIVDTTARDGEPFFRLELRSN